MPKPNTSNVILTLILIAFYGNVAYQNLRPNQMTLFQAAAAASINQPLNNKEVINYGAKRALIAIQENQAGVHEARKGCNCGPRVDLYTAGLHQQWCAMFTSWVFKEAGTPLQGPDPNQPWRITNARQIAEYLKKDGVWYSREKILRDHIQPRVGDVMIFWRGNFEGNLGHADIVVGVDPNKPGHASLVGGNLYDSVRYRESSYFEEYYGFLGFGRPKGEKITNSQSLDVKPSLKPILQKHQSHANQQITDPRIKRIFNKTR